VCSSDLFKGVQATGWYIPEYRRAQVTINILDLEAAPLHQVYDACCDLAAQKGLRVTGSEVVGMVPRRVLLESGRYFLKKQGQSTGVSEAELVETAAQSLGLSDVAPFDPKAKVIEERFRKPAPLADATVRRFLQELASRAPAPGGGSVAALSGALGAALCAMVSALTHEKKGHEAVRDEMEARAVKAQDLLQALVQAVDDDTDAFNKLMAAMGLPKADPAQAKARDAAIAAATKAATLEPLGVLEKQAAVLDCAALAERKGKPNAASDAGVAGLMARAAALGAYYNVLINLAGIKDKAWRTKAVKRAEAAVSQVLRKSGALEKAMRGRLRKPLK
jgi:glutamate formiminotransferase/formiminotetrahydrofolate cyclodeaminase